MFKHRHANNTPGGDSLSLQAKQNKTKKQKNTKKKTKKKKKKNNKTTNKQTCDFARMVLFLHCEEENAFH